MRVAHASVTERRPAIAVRRDPSAAAHPDGIPHRRWALALAVSAAVALSILVSASVEVGAAVHRVALFVHLASLVVGLGSVIAIDWHGLLWLVGRAQLADVLELSTRMTMPIWVGLAGLVASGALLSADPTVPLTTLKLVVVVVLAVNGVQVLTIQEQLVAADGNPPGRLLARGLATAALSQTCWWTATVIGFLNSSG